MARPTKKIDWKQVDMLCGIQCTGEEIAAVLDISYDTLERACKREKKVGFAEYFGQKRQSGKASLRRRQFKAAVEEGVPSMMIWLGKQYLGQSDKQEFSGNKDKPVELNITSLNRTQTKALTELLAKVNE